MKTGFISKLRGIRVKKGLSQSQLANLSEVSLAMTQKYEIGVKDINKAQADTVKKLAIALNCKMEDLVD